MVDLVKQLREVKDRDFDPASLRTMVLWGADEIERLRAALKPFADAAENYVQFPVFSLEQVRAAREAYEQIRTDCPDHPTGRLVDDDGRQICETCGRVS